MGRFMVACWMCGYEFVADSEKAQRWAESDKPFEPTDWECPNCGRALDEAFELYEEQYDCYDLAND